MYQRMTALSSSCKPPLIVSYATEGVYEEVWNRRLRPSLEEHGLEYHFETVKATPQGWIGNCALKGPFVYRCLQEFQRPVLWLDADAVVVRPPKDLYGDVDFDFAAYWKSPGEDHDRAILSGTIYFNLTDGGLGLCGHWAHLCETVRGVWDQRLLSRAWREYTPRPRHKALPQSYCKIFDRKWQPGELPLTVIEHHQASRQLKRKV